MKLRNDIFEVRAFAPATVTNVSCGFDVLGFALQNPGDEVRVRLSSKPGVRICSVQGILSKIPLQAENNTAGKALLAFLQSLNLKTGIEVDIFKRMSIGTGLGSSAASAVAAVWAFNQFLANPLPKEKLLPFALQGEKLTTNGTVHADNVAASLYGGFIVVRSVEPPDVIPISFPESLCVAIVHPQLEIKTASMRAILREHISLKDAVRQWGNVAALVAGLQTGDWQLIKRSLNDAIIEPVRGKVIPGFYEAQKAAIKSGALGSGLSGSGPSLFALCNSREQAQKSVRAMKKVYEKLQIGCDVYISPINDRGVRTVELTLISNRKGN